MTPKKFDKEIKQYKIIEINNPIEGYITLKLKNGILTFRVDDDAIFSQFETSTEKGKKIIENWGGSLNSGKNNFFSKRCEGKKKERIATNNQTFLDYIEDLNH